VENRTRQALLALPIYSIEFSWAVKKEGHLDLPWLGLNFHLHQKEQSMLLVLELVLASRSASTAA
jgi:hypothetical protein